MWETLHTVSTALGMLLLYFGFLIGLAIIVVRAYRRRSARADGRLIDGAPAGIDRRARSWDEVPEWVRADRSWAAAIVVLGADPLVGRTDRYVDFVQRRVDWRGLRRDAQEWDAEAHAFVEVAYALAEPSTASAVQRAQ